MALPETEQTSSPVQVAVTPRAVIVAGCVVLVSVLCDEWTPYVVYI